MLQPGSSVARVVSNRVGHIIVRCISPYFLNGHTMISSVPATTSWLMLTTIVVTGAARTAVTTMIEPVRHASEGVARESSFGSVRRQSRIHGSVRDIFDALLSAINEEHIGL